MTTNRTTAEALNTRAAKYVDGLSSDDPVAKANALISEAIRLQDAGHWEWADDKIAKAEALLETA